MRRCAIIIGERDRVTEAVRKLGVDVPESQSNFVWLPLADRSVAFAAACEERGVIVRPFPEGVRVTIGTPEENDTFLAAAEKALA
jgi:histidinol-phosphate aminotransferase